MTAIRFYGTSLAGAAVLAMAPGFGDARGADPASLCDLAAQTAAAESSVPVDVLMAITRVETGRKTDGTLRPWPWAVNLAGEGFWFADAAEAIAFADAQLAAGQENFDVGCFQINLHWHGAEFASLDDVFDPHANASYAAKFLTDLYNSEGSWPAAVAAYHSRTPEKAADYLQKVELVLANLGPANPSPTVEAEPARQNRFPLLQAGSTTTGASLVPLNQGAVPLFGAP